MGIFGGGNKPDPEAEARAEASRQNILAGNLPLNAIARLKEQASRQGTPAHFFSSDLSVNELALTHECGFDPLGQVMGSCVFSVGWQYYPSTSNWFSYSGELDVLSASQMDARSRAFKRLRDEAKLLKADGVVGVRFVRREGTLETGLLEFIAIGTAVRRRGAPPLAPGAEPFVSNLSGQDHWMLRKDGFKPVGFAFGNCSWFQYPDWRSQSAMMSWSNAEVTSLSQGMYTAREIAMDRMEREARADGAEGVVGMQIDTHHEIMESSNNQPGGFIIHFTAWGTAIGREDYHSDVEGIEPVVSLRDSDS